MKNLRKFLLILVVMLFQQSVFSQYQQLNRFKNTPDSEAAIGAMVTLLIGKVDKSQEVLQHLNDNWDIRYVPMLLDVLYFSKEQVDRKPIIKLIEEKTNKKFKDNLFKWSEWMWNKEEQIFPYHGDWMAKIYKTIDPKFQRYFKNRTYASLIRLDEVRWGGVQQDGIPPLRKPKMLIADKADYLADTDVVFGISINGDHRAYPKRILAWHEMFVDEIGGRIYRWRLLYVMWDCHCL